MKVRLGIGVMCLFLLSSYGFTQMPIVEVTNQPSSLVSIALIDPVRPETVPLGLRSHVSRLPLGSFLLHNHSSTPITAVVTQWVITSRTGVVEKEKLQCTGYKSTPLKTMIRESDFSLVTAHSCVKSEFFSALDQAVFNSPFQAGTRRRLVDRPDDIAQIVITVDSVIFENGDIWGPDTQKYYRRLWQEDLALQSVVNECSDAEVNGEDIRHRAKKIQDDLALKADRDSALRRRYALLLTLSSNPERLVSQFRSRQPLPEFRHIQEDKQ